MFLRLFNADDEQKSLELLCDSLQSLYMNPSVLPNTDSWVSRKSLFASLAERATVFNLSAWSPDRVSSLLQRLREKHMHDGLVAVAQRAQ